MLSFQVYDQLDSLAKHNPWFVQSLQNIMASTQTADASKPKLPTAAAPAVRPVPAPPAGSDPAQAALILLLAGKVTNPNHSAAQNAALLGKIVKQLETGVSAADILKGLVTDEKAEEAEVRPTGFPPANRPILLQTPPTASASSEEGQSKGDLNSIISKMSVSKVRQNFHSNCEANINKQINMELYASYVYMSMVTINAPIIIR